MITDKCTVETIEDYFDYKSGSRVWPSDDPNDSPFDTFTCKLCGWSFKQQTCGSFPMNYDPWETVKSRKSEHLRNQHNL